MTNLDELTKAEQQALRNLRKALTKWPKSLVFFASPSRLRIVLKRNGKIPTTSSSLQTEYCDSSQPVEGVSQDAVVEVLDVPYDCGEVR